MIYKTTALAVSYRIINNIYNILLPVLSIHSATTVIAKKPSDGPVWFILSFISDWVRFDQYLLYADDVFHVNYDLFIFNEEW